MLQVISEPKRTESFRRLLCTVLTVLRADKSGARASAQSRAGVQGAGQGEEHMQLDPGFCEQDHSSYTAPKHRKRN